MPDFLNKKLKNKHLIVLCDEAHEADIDVLEWLRVLSDQVDNMSLILSGLPVFEQYLHEKLETFEKRITTKIELVSLTKEETQQLIEKRIANVGGHGIEPFSEDIVDLIFEKTGGFPREVIRACDFLVNAAISQGKTKITPDLFVEKPEEEKKISLNILETLTSRQRQIIDMLAKKTMSPGDIANSLDLGSYKSRQHAVRSVNNILIRMMEEGFVERRRTGREFEYTLSPKLKTIVIKT